MRYSLISRDLIADCIESVHEAYMSDAMITLSGCDKTVTIYFSSKFYEKYYFLK
jgi:dihydroxyacid dehydratase/phosphogluconate dehydratase